jgi:probable F420-dependent oxidoreductase
MEDGMKIGIVYPQTELGGRAEAVRRIGVAVEELGFDHLTFYDHVVGALHAGREPKLWGPYTDRDPFHDPFVAFGFLAALTKRIELVTGVLILPQRQTVLVARQAADVDILSRQRLRLGVGTGWNYVEYHALGQDFSRRGARIDEQIELLRRLWSEPLVTFQGKFDAIDRGNINPRPARPIPIWIGGFAEPAFRRGGRLGDGFIFAGPLQGGGDLGGVLDGWERVQHHLAESGRSREGYGADWILTAQVGNDIVELIERWQDAGGTHATVVTMGRGFDTVEAHLDYVADVAARLKL